MGIVERYVPAHVSGDEDGVHHLVFEVSAQHIGPHQIPVTRDKRGGMGERVLIG